MVFEAVECPTCGGVDIHRHGQSATGKKRYICLNTNCMRKTFILDYTYQGYRPEVKEQIAEMAINGSGIRDTGRVLKISPNTVIKELKKHRKTLKPSSILC
jgi:transposase-like protein